MRAYKQAEKFAKDCSFEFTIKATFVKLILVIQFLVAFSIRK